MPSGIPKTNRSLTRTESAYPPVARSERRASRKRERQERASRKKDGARGLLTSVGVSSVVGKHLLGAVLLVVVSACEARREEGVSDARSGIQAREGRTLSAVSIREDLGSDSDGVSDLELGDLGSDLGDLADDLVSSRGRNKETSQRR